jgi:hypothetical protein
MVIDQLKDLAPPQTSAVSLLYLEKIIPLERKILNDLMAELKDLINVDVIKLIQVVLTSSFEKIEQFCHKNITKKTSGNYLVFVFEFFKKILICFLKGNSKIFKEEEKNFSKKLQRIINYS